MADPNQNRCSFWPCVVSLVMIWSIVEHNLGESSGSTVDVARRAGYPWPEQMARKMLRNVEKRGVHAARNGPSEDSKCWQRLELGIHGLKSWGRNWSRKAGRVRRACDDAPLSISVPLCDAPYLLAPGKRGLPPTFPWNLFFRPTPHAPRRRLEIGFVFACLIPPLFVLSHSLPMVNTMGKLASFGRFLSPSSLPLQFHWLLAISY